MPHRRLLALTLVLGAALLVPAASAAARVVPHVSYRGLQHLHFRYGPINIAPGQNNIVFRPTSLKPNVPGYITRFRPNLRYTNGKVPRVDVLHLHHGVWLINNYPTFAVGEEKTILQLPRGFGFPSKPSDSWIINYMIHDLLPDPARVYITYDLDFLPASAPAAKRLKTAKPLWMDVAGIRAYPVFDVHRGDGTNGRYTFPDQAQGAEVDKIGSAHEYTVRRPMTLLATAGHLHPGGLYTDLKATRGDTTKLLFRSRAHYFEPAGAVSWDVALGATRPDWRLQLQPGDRLNLSATYDTRRASWYESMGIDVVWYHPGTDGGGVDPFTHPFDRRGAITHGHLPENNNHGGQPGGLPDAREMISGFSEGGIVNIQDFIYQQGDLALGGRDARPPTVKAGQSLTFKNLDSSRTIWHTITACRAPCSRQTGIAYPLANGQVDFDSGELGYGPPGFSPTANRDTWQTPANLQPGTYTYFCRIHPFMRGAFRVVR